MSQVKNPEGELGMNPYKYKYPLGRMQNNFNDEYIFSDQQMDHNHCDQKQEN